MKKSEALNTFTQGLVMDINPLVAPNDGVCNALNATLITMNGNENVLQNDMGNGRVETAFLPEGYIPLGTTELGGIIYIVSYNPINKRCQIGSFPSPERNISSDEVIDLKQQLTNEDFKYSVEKENGEMKGATEGALVYYLKKELNKELIFNPGDKFIVYGDAIYENFDKLYNETSYTSKGVDIAKDYTIKLDIGTVTDTGKLVKFKNLKLYNIKDDKSTEDNAPCKGEYHIFQYSGGSTQSPDLDEYRSLVSQPYNVFSSKISGSLVLITELVQFNDFDVSLKHSFTQEDNYKIYNPNITFTLSGDYPFIPKGVKGTISLSGNDIEEELTDSFEKVFGVEEIKEQISKSNTSYEFNYILFDENNKVYKKIKELSENGYFDTKERNKNYIIKYAFTPCMNWGKIQYLETTGQIYLDKLGTGYIGLSTWRYYNEPNKLSLTWGLEIYEEEGYRVDSVEMEFIRIISYIDSEINTETVTYKISNKESYFGIFYDIIPLNEDFDKLNGQLKSNCLYLVKIIAKYNSIDGVNTNDKIFYRWLYTNNVFNSYYASVNDFAELKLDFTPDVNVSYNTSMFDTGQVASYGDLRRPTGEFESDEEIEEYKNNTLSSLSAIQTSKSIITNCNLQVGLKDNYNTFYLEVDKQAFNIELGESTNSTGSSISSTGTEDINQDEYLKSESKTTDNLNDYKINKETSGESLLNIPALVSTSKLMPQHTIGGGVSSIIFRDNTYSLKILSPLLQTVKAYCTRAISDMTYKGYYIPLAYDKDTFKKYNLQWNGEQWSPTILGTFGFQYGNKGRTYIGLWNTGESEGYEHQLICAQEIDQKEYGFNWARPEIQAAQSQMGWTNTAIFFVHYHGGHTLSNGTPGSSLKNYNGQEETEQNSGSIYSRPAKQTNYFNRIQLAFLSASDDYFHPINCSIFGVSDVNTIGNLTAMVNHIDFKNIFHDFAQYIHSIYRYDDRDISQEYIFPNDIYWMQECKYQLTNSINVNISGAFEKNHRINLILEQGQISLSEIVDKLISAGILKGNSDNYPTLENNIISSVQSDYTNTVKINVQFSDNTTGIKLRDYILSQSDTTSRSAIIDYDGKSIIGTAEIPTNKNGLFDREAIVAPFNTPSIRMATEFYPRVINYDENGNFESLGNRTIDSGPINPINLNKYFSINYDGLLVLNNKTVTSEHKFIREDYWGQASNGASIYYRGEADGYLKVCILPQYKSY